MNGRPDDSGAQKFDIIIYKKLDTGWQEGKGS